MSEIEKLWSLDVTPEVKKRFLAVDEFLAQYKEDEEESGTD